MEAARQPIPELTADGRRDIMPAEHQTISLDDPAYKQAIQMITAVTAAATEAAQGDPQPAVRALVFVLSMYLDADRQLTTNKGIRERGEEVGKVVAGQVRWMRDGRQVPDEPMLHAMMREMAGRASAPSFN
jgi:hypothetical protein